MLIYFIIYKFLNCNSDKDEIRMKKEIGNYKLGRRNYLL
jgi:hypothetical protein